MSTECREVVALLLAILGGVVAIRVWPPLDLWWQQHREQRAAVRQFRRQLERLDSRHVDALRRSLGGRDSPH